MKKKQEPGKLNLTPEARRLLDWLHDLPGKEERRVVIGQYVTRNANNSSRHTAASAWEHFYVKVGEQTGKYPGLAGFCFSQRSVDGAGGENSPSDCNWREYAAEHARRGGMLRLMWHAANPWTNETSWSSVPEGHQLAELYTPGNDAYDRWNGWLSELADCLAWYGEQRIPVLWGPLHEMNGRWFWWGTGEEEQYRRLWCHMHEYLTGTRGLNHLLWMFCPDARADGDRPLQQYPGNRYVDIIAPDLYYSSPESQPDSRLYQEFSKPSYGKVLGWGEIGTEKARFIDNRKYMEDIRSHFPLVTLYMQWADVDAKDRMHPFSIVSNLHTTELFLDQWGIDRAGILT